MKVTGLMINYYFVCQKKLWYFSHKLNMESESELVKIGKFLDESTYQREQHNFAIEDLANIDYLKNNTVYEIKKSASESISAIYQVKYYLYLLYKRGLKDLKGQIKYPALKKTELIVLKEEDILEIEKIIEEISSIIEREVPIEQKIMAKCKKCAYYDFCFI